MKVTVLGLLTSAMALAACGEKVDRSNCSTFLLGTWQGETKTSKRDPGYVSTDTMAFYADGRYEQRSDIVIDGEAFPEDDPFKATWTAKVGKRPDTCAIDLVYEDGKPGWDVLSIVDDDTVTRVYDGAFRRQ